uniref:HTH lysR-type domain-containing protein n=1 Tax=mine drainage metagenome TaxID=410659 RepID=E6Q922_9ZZZZ
MMIDAEQLLTLFTVAEAGSVSEAALRLGRGQPAISERLHKLTREIGTLFCYQNAARQLSQQRFGDRPLQPVSQGKMRNMPDDQQVGTRLQCVTGNLFSRAALSRLRHHPQAFCMERARDGIQTAADGIAFSPQHILRPRRLTNGHAAGTDDDAEEMQFTSPQTREFRALTERYLARWAAVISHQNLLKHLTPPKQLRCTACESLLRANPQSSPASPPRLAWAGE